MAQGYGKVGNRRRGSGAFQWLVIGVFIGLMCGILFFFILLLTGALAGFVEPVVQEVTREVEVQVNVVFTATPDPNASPEVQIITATPAPVEATNEPVVVVPTATMTPDPLSAAAPTLEPTVGQTTETISQEIVPEAVTDTPAVDIPPQLAQIVSPLVTVRGREAFELGTTNQEIVEAALTCQEQGGNCPATDGQDSTPIVRIQVADFQMEQTEVTFDQYVTYLNWLSSQGQRHTTACSGFICIQTANENPEGAVITFDSANYSVPAGLLNHPVYGVTWYGAEAYCTAIGRRLPTEIEWEYAARSGERRRYPWGDEFSEISANTRIPIDGEQGTTPVGQYTGGRTLTGIYDMSGNVAEWVQDWYSPSIYSELASQPQPVTDPGGPISGLEKVLRGGSWNTFPFYTRTYHRQSHLPVPDVINDPQWPRWVGFRCAADAGASTPAVTDPASLTVPEQSTSSDAPPEAEEGEQAAPRG